MVEVRGERGEGVEASSSKTIQENFVLPRILVNSNSRFCNVVQVSYDLFVEVQVSGWHNNFKMVFPIVIGSVPIDFGQTNIAPMQMPVQTQYNDFTNGPMPSTPMPYNDFTKPMMTMPEPRKLNGSREYLFNSKETFVTSKLRHRSMKHSR
jgi:hypothetical protein